MIVAGIGYVLVTPFVWFRKVLWAAKVDAMFADARKKANVTLDN